MDDPFADGPRPACRVLPLGAHDLLPAILCHACERRATHALLAIDVDRPACPMHAQHFCRAHHLGMPHDYPREWPCLERSERDRIERFHADAERRRGPGR